MAGGGLDEELKRRLKLPAEAWEVSNGPGVGLPAASQPSAPTHNCQMVDFFFSWTDGCSRDALQGRGREGAQLNHYLASQAPTHPTMPTSLSPTHCPANHTHGQAWSLPI